MYTLPYKKELIENTLKSLNYSTDIKEYKSYDEILEITKKIQSEIVALKNRKATLPELNEYLTNFLNTHVKTTYSQIFVNKESVNYFDEIPYEIIIDPKYYANEEVYFKLNYLIAEICCDFSSVEQAENPPLMLIPYFTKMIEFFSNKRTKNELKKELEDFFSLPFSSTKNKPMIGDEDAFEYALYTFYAVSKIDSTENIGFLKNFLKKHFTKEEINLIQFTKPTKLPETQNKIENYIVDKI